MEKGLSEDDRRALRGSKFAPLPVLPSRTLSRLAHPNGPMATNKAAALAKFLERKLQQPGGIDSIDPDLLEVAVKNAKETVNASNGRASSSRSIVRHVSSFGGSTEEDCEELHDQDLAEETKSKRKKQRKVSKDQDRAAEIPEKKKKLKKRKKLQNAKVHKSKKQKKFESRL